MDGSETLATVAALRRASVAQLRDLARQLECASFDHAVEALVWLAPSLAQLERNAQLVGLNNPAGPRT